MTVPAICHDSISNLSNTQKILLACCLLHLALGSKAFADEVLPQPESMGDVEAVFTPGEAIPIRQLDHDQAAISIDGHLDEAAWMTLPLFDRLVVVEPDTMAVPKYGTEFRMFYTDKGIFAAFHLEQPVETIVKRFTARDDVRVNRDDVSIQLDISGEGRYGYWMNLSLGDGQMDGTIKPEREYSKRWDGAWYGATQQDEDGWSAEFFIPWSQMAMPKVSGTRRIGVYIKREVAQLKEEWGWPPLPKSQPRFLSAMQPLEFEGVDPRSQWSVFPYLSATHDRVDEQNLYKAGFEVFWRPSSNLQLNAAVNPDFGTVEADDVVVNLTANETFFPEKRLFFLEGQEIFTTTPRANAPYGPKAVLVNTRRIGGRPDLPELPDDGEFSEREELKLAELLAAVKATGQLGSFRYGLLGAMEDDTAYRHDDIGYIQEGRDFGALRLLYEDDHGAAYRGLGFISTMVRHRDSDAIVQGLDFHRLSTDGRWNINGQVLYSDLSDEGKGYGAFTDFDYAPRQGVNHKLQLTWYDDKLDINDLGYLRRNDTTGGRYHYSKIRSGLTKVRNLDYGGLLNYAQNSDGYRTDITMMAYSDFVLNNLHSLDIFFWHAPSRFDDRNSFDNGVYEVEAASSIELTYRTDTARKVSAFASFSLKGESLGGHTSQYHMGLTWRPRDNITLGAQARFQDRNGWLLHQEDENFTTFDAAQWEPEVSFDYFFSARQHFRLVFQWVGIRAEEDEFFALEDGGTSLVPGPKPPGDTDDFSVSELTFQVRYRWQIAPLSDLYVVYTRGDSRETDLMSYGDLLRESWRNPLGDQLVVKLRYRFGS